MAEQYLRRYTDLPALLYMLHERKISLLDPRLWDDSNDSYYLSLYAELKNFTTLLALCFTELAETYHHWKIFAPGPAGVCVVFRKKSLLDAVSKQKGISFRRVTYHKLEDISGSSPSVDELPFMKRYAFQHDKEFRFIYQRQLIHESKLDIPIPIASINKIVLSPWVHKGGATHIRTTIRSIQGCGRLKIYPSSLIGNDRWKAFGDKALDGHGT
jgi:hypothetical protein